VLGQQSDVVERNPVLSQVRHRFGRNGVLRIELLFVEHRRESGKREAARIGRHIAASNSFSR